MKENGILKNQLECWFRTLEQTKRKHGKILDVFPITLMNTASTVEMTKKGKLAATRVFPFIKMQLPFLVIKIKMKLDLNR